jgi:hypothetical protein
MSHGIRLTALVFACWAYLIYTDSPVDKTNDWQKGFDAHTVQPKIDTT